MRNILSAMATTADSTRVTKASLALHRKFESRHGYAAEVSRRTRISPSRLSRIADGILFPRADEGAALVAEGIPIAWWRVPATNRVKRSKPAA